MTFERELRELFWMKIVYVAFYVGAIMQVMLMFVGSGSVSLAVILGGGGIGMMAIHQFSVGNLKEKYASGGM